jgi:polyphosphate kinase
VLKKVEVPIKKQKSKILYKGASFDPKRFFNRDLSWLEFNSRVLHQALSKETPLLERLRFIDIFRSNNDELCMKRIGPLLDRIYQRDHRPHFGDINSAELYIQIKAKIKEQWDLLNRAFAREIFPGLKKNGIHLVGWAQLNALEKKQMNQYFLEQVFPLLTPLAVDAGHPFPFLSNLSKSIGLCLIKGKKRNFARVKIPHEIPQIIPVKVDSKGQMKFINIEEIIIANLHKLFTGLKIESHMIFKVTRNAAISDDMAAVEDVMEQVEEGLWERKFAPIIRLEYQKNKDPWIINFLQDQLEIKPSELLGFESILNYTNFTALYGLRKPQLKYPAFVPTKLKGFEHTSSADEFFSELKKKDLMAHFPYNSYTESVEQFLKFAAHDPQTKAIKITLYRTDTEGRLIDLLIEAAENKKQVACVIELKARFDEEKNIKWANRLEEFGIHVSYGHGKYKTHAKMMLVIREENKSLVSYVNIGTGNYNSQTSKFYTDLSYFTASKAICQDVLELFNYLTGISTGKTYQKLLVAPQGIAKSLLQLIDEEIQMVKKHGKGLIIAKMNSLEDPQMIEALYRASQAGVEIHLIVRGFCILKAGIPKLSHNIKVYSLVGRFLEHSRIYYFGLKSKAVKEAKIYIGSPDLMYRNLHERVEILMPVLDLNFKEQITELLQTELSDNQNLWTQKPDGSYQKVLTTKKQKSRNAHVLFLGEQKVKS